ncbi:MAG: response regulator transcription factor [bacterium]|nr:response regulator transcription factor [bacterium]
MEFRLTGVKAQCDNKRGMNGMRVYVFSYIRLFSEALAAYLESSNRISVVKTCYRADNLVEEVIDFLPNIVLIDFTNEHALTEARAVSAALPGIPTLALALPENAGKVIACADAGLAGYISREESVEELVEKCLERSGANAFATH